MTTRTLLTVIGVLAVVLVIGFLTKTEPTTAVNPVPCPTPVPEATATPNGGPTYTPTLTHTPCLTKLASTPTWSPTPTATVTPTPAGPGPDLVALSMSATLETGGDCDYVTKLGVRVKFSNTGDTDAGPFVVTVNGVHQNVGGLLQGESGTLWFNGFNTGLNILFVVDSAFQVLESNEQNNQLFQQPPIPSLPPTCTPAPPTSAPLPPTNLQAMVVQDALKITLLWDDNADNEVQYVLERRSSAGPDGPWGVAAVLPANSTSYNDSGLEDGVTYWYRVAASNAVGTSGYSNVVFGTATALPTPRPGDADCSGQVTSVDAALVLQFDAGLLDILVFTCLLVADVNEDGTVNALDATLILQFAAGLIDNLPP